VPFTKVMTDAGILPGIKVDKGPQPLAGFPGEVVTEGLDGLRERLKEYAQLGARFAKWRAVINIGEDIPPAPASRPTATRWPATPRCARKPASCRWSNPKC
jgi:fructose-bisphosphate aldolase class I